MRLHKFLSQAGVASRRKAEQLIEAGRVSVNGEIITTLGYIISETDIIMVDQQRVLQQDLVYFMLYKPKGYLSSVADDRNRQVVVDLIKSDVSVFPVGRLDLDTTGLLILTNDGQFAHTMMHPSFEIEKSYEVTIQGRISASELEQLEQGVILDDGSVSDPARIEAVKKQGPHSMVALTITQGKNRIIRRMFQALVRDVVNLHRYQYGNLTLGQLGVGESRALTAAEVAALYGLAKE
jgi:23S rRNA pseudouridine2605 synthase